MKRFIPYVLSLALLGQGACSTNNKTEEKEQAVVTEEALPDDERMAWWRDAGFGMFIHWGLYSIPAGIYKGDTVRGNAEWIMDKLDIPVEEYEKFAGQFNPVKFDADQWVKIAKDAGMKYIVITTKHHEGFCLWDSEITDYDIMDASPFKRDILAELAEACEKEGIKLCFYHSIVDWHHPQAQAPLYPNYNAGQKDSTVFNPEFSKYYDNYLKPQIKELLTNYGEVGVVWFDGDWIPDYTTEMGKELYSFIRDIQPNTIVNNRVDKGRTGMSGMNKEGSFAGDFGTPEKEIPDTGIEGVDWESCLTMNNTWGFKTTDHNWKSSETLVQDLVDIVSKGGNLLLNVGPTSEGEIPSPSVERLAVMGDWLDANGESIYGAEASPFSRPDWGRYTSKDGVIYAHVFDIPNDRTISVHPDIAISSATLLASPDQAVEVDKEQHRLRLPEGIEDEAVTVIKIQ
ncbi:alpha-L-fucosidase [Echinicola strongylocentroti]|uniref:alpha-L-fucosidase n=1 Tax=Echinicola strongylocentroti TaxID=1795355 RepID=A0A2Z4INR6_9BACT|nr:alpha-L-fucosidase [Echinicola strongylocentroti]AWW32761.1 alpha-L-fucosidase [Echinicola strongylocentroti]